MRETFASPDIPLLPSRLWVFIGLGLTPLFYWILRSAYSAPTLTVNEQLFIWPYAMLCTFNWIIAYSRGSRIQAYLPQWLNIWWARVALYLVVFLALTEILKLLKLPAFYDAVIGKSLMFLVLPFLMPSPRTVKTSRADQALLVSAGSMGGDLILNIKSSKATVVLVASVTLMLGGAIMLPKFPVLGWIDICFFGLGILVGVALQAPGACCLILKRDEFIVVNLWRRLPCRWSEVTDFIVVQTPQGPRVAWNFNQDVPSDAPYWRKRIAARKYVTEMFGRNAILSDDYGVSPDELCRIMADRAARAQSTTSLESSA